MKFLKNKNDPAEMPFLDHLEELRWRILWSLLAVIVGSIAGFVIVTRFKVLDLLIEPIKPFLGPDQRLGYLSPTDPFMITIGLALTVGFLLAFPIVAAQIWAFISPALHKREKRAIVPALYLGLILFAIGVTLAYFYVLPMTFKFMTGFQTTALRQQITVGPYISVVVKLLLAFGAIFELPVVVLVLATLGLVTSKFLAEKRRFAIAASAIVAALLTPGDVFMITIMMMGPIILLYEISILLARLVERRRRRHEAEDGLGVAAALIAFLLFTASGASAQQQQQQQQQQRPAADTTKPKTTQEIVREKLRQIGKERADTIVIADSTLERMRRDSVRSQRAATPPPEIGADSIMLQLLRLEGYTATQYRALSARFNSDSGKLVLTATPEEKAFVVQAEQSMSADSLLVVNRNTSIACGFGNPVLSGEGAENPVKSERVCYDTQRRIGTAIGASTQFSQGANWQFTGDLSTRERDIYGHNTRFTDCTLTIPHYHFSAKRVKVVNGDVLVARDVTLQFGDVPVFWLPFMMQSLKRGRASGILMPRFSVNDIVRRNSRYNRRIENVGFYWAVSEHMGSELTMDWFANNWTALNGSLDYKWNDQFLDGRLTYRQFWKSEGGREFTLASGNSWQPDERTSLRADLQYSTSSSFIRDRSYDPRELNRSIDSNAGLNRRFDWGSVSLQASRRQYLTDNKVDMTLPSVGLNLSSVTFFKTAGTPRFYHNATWTGSAQARLVSSAIDQTLQPRNRDREDLNANLNSSIAMGNFSWSQAFDLRNEVQRELLASGDSVDAAPEITNRRMNWSTSLGFQQRLIGTSTITPSMSLRGELARDSTGRMVSAPARMDFGATMKVDLFGFWPGVGPLERIRHRVSPTFSYSFSPSTNPDSAQMLLFSASAAREQNRLSIGLSQTIEGKFREERREGQDSVVVEDTVSLDPDKPRRVQQGRKVQLLSLNTDAVVYDFVEARTGMGVQTTQITNSINSDLLRGLQLSVTHDLFRLTGTGSGVSTDSAGRDFAPHLSRVSASFSLTGSSWLFRALGLSGVGEPEAPPATGSTPTPVPDAAQAGPPTDPTRPEMGLLGTRNRPADGQQQAPRSAIGSWNASLNYTLYRPRTAAVDQGNQMVTANLNFHPTEMWNVAWNTGYSFSEGQFTDHVLTLTRAMHDWDANFDFIRAQNGNFSFQFRVALRANPDIKFDYDQRDAGPATTRATR